MWNFQQQISRYLSPSSLPKTVNLTHKYGLCIKEGGSLLKLTRGLPPDFDYRLYEPDTVVVPIMLVHLWVSLILSCGCQDIEAQQVFIDHQLVG